MGNENTKAQMEAVDLLHASSTVQGRRPYNEDRCEARHPLIIPKREKDRGVSFFAVYDGHGGESCAEWCSQQLHAHIASQPTFKGTTKDRAIHTGFFSCDFACLAEQNKAENPLEPSGTTVSCLLVDHHHYYAGNIGDTRTLLCRNGRCIDLSKDHKPTDEEEKKRVESGGGRVNVTEHKLVNKRTGKVTVITQAYVELQDKGLAVSRAFGNPAFKSNKEKKEEEQIIVCTPHIVKEERQTNLDEFILLASDGLWIVMENQAACDWVRKELADHVPTPNLSPSQEAEEQQDLLNSICNRLTQLALDKKSNDNVTVLLVLFPAAKSIKTRMASGSSSAPPLSDASSASQDAGLQSSVGIRAAHKKPSSDAQS
jgi:protein phosphatase 2C family protein 2/3